MERRQETGFVGMKDRPPEGTRERSKLSRPRGYGKGKDWLGFKPGERHRSGWSSIRGICESLRFCDT